ncbi:hypothetical protein K474DRAFT_1668238 [Panus rudis PR-1116 ss-1]|nr:hypothetical protein K474DRAFT_1668238 [Panus rudis PR-1116 ss-1]
MDGSTTAWSSALGIPASALHLSSMVCYIELRFGFAVAKGVAGLLLRILAVYKRLPNYAGAVVR